MPVPSARIDRSHSRDRSWLIGFWIFLLGTSMGVCQPDAMAQPSFAEGTATPSVVAPTVEPNQPSGDYDPLRVGKATIETLLLDVIEIDSNRKIPIKIYLPAEDGAPAPIVLFSHGLGGDRESCLYLGNHWAGRGYVGVFLQHPGSDDSVWKDVPPRERMRRMGQAANFENMQLRFRDVAVVLDQLEKWNRQADHELKGRCNLEKVGMSGHSFGAVTTQGVSGQTFFGQTRWTDNRIKAAVIFSPSAPRVGTTKNAFGNVKLPWLLITGTNDVAPIGNVDVQNRLSVYEPLPADGRKYQLVLDQAEHSAFTDRELPGERTNRNSNHHRAILGITTSFWDVYLKDDSQAKAFLNSSDRVRQLLEPKDQWDQK